MDFVTICLILFPFFLTSNYSIDDDENDSYTKKRWEMVEMQLISRGIKDPNVIKAMLKIPRHKFIPEELRGLSYNDAPVPIGMDQTISQPYIVALMTELLNLREKEKVLEVGTGSGYQAAILAEIGCEVYTIEIIKSLSVSAQKMIKGLGYQNVHFKIGDGYRGWSEHSPFDAIIVSAAPQHTPQPLIDQLKVNGRMVIPIGDIYQELMLIHKTQKGIEKTDVTPVRFVPMTGEAQSSREN
jgi:protein-L-isoaspartate(D-aspartate) O-methyltransferase